EERGSICQVVNDDADMVQSGNHHAAKSTTSGIRGCEPDRARGGMSFAEVVFRGRRPPEFAMGAPGSRPNRHPSPLICEHLLRSAGRRVHVAGLSCGTVSGYTQE